MHLRKEGWERRLKRYAIPECQALVAPPRTTVTVRCNGQLHKITFDGQHLHLCDHPNQQLERTLEEFGDTCRCIQVQRLWKDGATRGNGLPDGFNFLVHNWRPTFSALRELATQRETSYETWALLGYRGQRRLSHLGDKKTREWSPLIDGCVPALRYKHFCQAPLWRPYVERVGQYQELGFSRHYPYVHFCVGWAWKQRVFDADLAVVDGFFILDVLQPRDVEHYQTRRYMKNSGTPWWSVYGEEPDLARGPYVLMVKETTRGFYNWPARVVLTKDESGCERRSLEPYKKPRQKKQPPSSAS